MKIHGNKYILFLLIIIAVGTFLRGYHFGDWMHYELDQARDFRIIDAAITYGPGELPLQGPRAAGSFLRLGPLFYYLEYGSALIFGNTPTGTAMIVLILSILSIPLFYVFARQFFNKEWSLGFTMLFAVSLFLVTYGRFAWNPNPVPFFTLAFLYCLLRTVDRTEKRRGLWLILASLAIAFLINMHFLALAAMPLVGIIFLLLTRPQIALSSWMIAIIVFLFLQTPLIVNDIKTGGDNVKEFIAVIVNRSEGNKHTLIEQVTKNITQHVENYWIILTGYQNVELPTVGTQGEGVLDVRCDHMCRQNLPVGIIALVFFGSGVFSMILLWVKEREKQKKHFLLLIAIWFVIIFLSYTPLAFDLSPRFFLLTSPVAFFLPGFIFTLFFHSGKRKSIAWIIIAIFALTNLLFIGQYFSQLSRADHDQTLTIGTDRILKEKTRMTRMQEEAIVDYMEARYNENHFPVFMHGQAEFKRAFWERIEFRNIPRDHIPQSFNPLYRQGNYFVVIRTSADQKAYMEKYWDAFNLIDMKNFGTLSLYYISPKEEVITHDAKIFPKENRDPQFSPGVQVRYLWRQVLE